MRSGARSRTFHGNSAKIFTSGVSSLRSELVLRESRIAECIDKVWVCLRPEVLCEVGVDNLRATAGLRTMTGAQKHGGNEKVNRVCMRGVFVDAAEEAVGV